MSWYAYCVGEKLAFPELARHRKPVPLESCSGVYGNQVFLYPASEFAIVVSEHHPSTLLDQQAGLHHARVIAECFSRSTVLPFRFGTIFQSEEALRRSVRSNQRQFSWNIEKLRGKAEMHLKISVEDGCGDREAERSKELGIAGKEYLSNLRESATLQRERQTRGRAMSFHMHRLFNPLGEEVSCRRTEGGRMLLDISHLIDRKNVERYQNKFATVSSQLKECPMQLSGPWPPYHFVHRLTRGQHIALPTPAAPVQSEAVPA